MYTGKQQQGAVIVVAMVFLLMTSFIATTVMKTSVLEVRMAGNAQLREESFQQVQAVANAISANTNNLVIAGDVGYMICETGGNGCDAHVIALNAAVTNVPVGVDLDFYAERLAPLFAPMPFRAGEDNADSATAYAAAKFEVNALFDGVAAGLGKSHIAQGIAMRVAVNGQ